METHIQCRECNKLNTDNTRGHCVGLKSIFYRRRLLSVLNVITLVLSVIMLVFGSIFIKSVETQQIKAVNVAGLCIGVSLLLLIHSIIGLCTVWKQHSWLIYMFMCCSLLSIICDLIMTAVITHKLMHLTSNQCQGCIVPGLFVALAFVYSLLFLIHLCSGILAYSLTLRVEARTCVLHSIVPPEGMRTDYNDNYIQSLQTGPDAGFKMEYTESVYHDPKYSMSSSIADSRYKTYAHHQSIDDSICSKARRRGIALIDSDDIQELHYPYLCSDRAKSCDNLSTPKRDIKVSLVSDHMQESFTKQSMQFNMDPHYSIHLPQLPIDNPIGSHHKNSLASDLYRMEVGDFKESYTRTCDDSVFFDMPDVSQSMEANIDHTSFHSDNQGRPQYTSMNGSVHYSRGGVYSDTNSRNRLSTEYLHSNNSVPNLRGQIHKRKVQSERRPVRLIPAHTGNQSVSQDKTDLEVESYMTAIANDTVFGSYKGVTPARKSDTYMSATANDTVFGSYKGATPTIKSETYMSTTANDTVYGSYKGVTPTGKSDTSHNQSNEQADSVPKSCVKPPSFLAHMSLPGLHLGEKMFSFRDKQSRAKSMEVLNRNPVTGAYPLRPCSVAEATFPPLSRAESSTQTLMKSIFSGTYWKDMGPDQSISSLDGFNSLMTSKSSIVNLQRSNNAGLLSKDDSSILSKSYTDVNNSTASSGFGRSLLRKSVIDPSVVQSFQRNLNPPHTPKYLTTPSIFKTPGQEVSPAESSMNSFHSAQLPNNHVKRLSAQDTTLNISMPSYNFDQQLDNCLNQMMVLAAELQNKENSQIHNEAGVEVSPLMKRKSRSYTNIGAYIRPQSCDSMTSTGRPHSCNSHISTVYRPKSRESGSVTSQCSGTWETPAHDNSRYSADSMII